MRLVLTAEARSDLVGISDAIARDNPSRAVTFIEEIEAHCSRIVHFSDAHPILEGFGQSGIRKVPHGNYLILLRSTRGRVEVLKVVHGARDLGAVLRQPGSRID